VYYLASQAGTVGHPSTQGLTATTGTFTGAFTSLGIDDNADATAITIDSSERVMIGTTTEGEVSSDDLTIAGSDNTGITIRSGTASNGAIYFSDGTSGAAEYRGILDYDHNDNKFRIFTNALERMRIDNDGHLMINSTSVSGAAKLTVKFPDASEEGISLVGSDNASGSGFVVFRKANDTVIGQIKKNGTSDAVQYVTSSDYRLKENLSYSFDATTRVKQLKPARFNFISDPNNTVVDGFLAHEVSSIVPEAIDGDKDATQDISAVVLQADGEVVETNVPEAQWTVGKSDGTYAANTTWVASKTVPKYQGIDQSKLVPLLVKTIQELEARITALEG